MSRAVLVVGAGPVGCLAAIAFARRGWKVQLVESRPDPRELSSQHGNARSINLAISHRGIAALQAIDPHVSEIFLQSAIPMKGRMIHHLSGSLDSQPYDKDGQSINSIDRAALNRFLLDEVSKLDNVQLDFNRKVQFINFDEGSLVARDTVNGCDVDYIFDLCVGADGSYSIVRRQMMKVVRMDYQQEYIQDEYIEIRIPPGCALDGSVDFLLDPSHLHIWPRHSFMLIALPNKDKSFTCTLFAPGSELNSLRDSNKVVPWFEANFPDVVPIIGKNELVKSVCTNPRSPLICTKSNPYHYKDRAILLGDAAHSMVPFYGQGLNCGLEDVRVLDALLQERGIASLEKNQIKNSVYDGLSQAFDYYTKNRHDDLVAICDLAMDNYVEMRHKVLSPVFLVRKSVDNFLYGITSSFRPLTSFGPILSQTPFPKGAPRSWLPLYTMVTFRPDISYATARRKARRQARILNISGLVALSVLGAGIAKLVLWSS